MLRLIISCHQWRKSVHTLFVIVCARGGVRDLELRFADMRAMSLPGDGMPEYTKLLYDFYHELRGLTWLPVVLTTRPLLKCVVLLILLYIV